MTSERWRHIDDLYHAALEQAADQRARYLEKACGGDADLRHDVESLLAHVSEGDRLMETPAWEQAAPLFNDASSSKSARLAAGAQLGPYRVIDLLGAGGMGEVYRAKDTRLGREVALKLLPRDRVSDPERRRRFLQEARAASALNHPHIVTFFDLAAADGQDFLVMEYVAGETLDQVIRDKRPPIAVVLSWGIQIADALAAAHHAGIVHRDLKPANTMVSAKGAIKLLDFGLAKLAEPEPAPDAGAAPDTSSGVILGTLSYMSPEQAEGRPADARSDIFSFGAVLYELITGQRAFRADSPAATLNAILHDEPKITSSLAHGAPHELENIVLRCLRRDPERRFQHAGDLKTALVELKEEMESARGRVKRPWRGVGIALAALAMFAISAGAWLLYYRAPKVEAPLMLAPFTTYPGYELDPEFSPDGNQVAFEWEGRNQDNSDIYMKLVGPGEPIRLTTDPARDHSPAWSPDGRWIAFLREAANDGAAGNPAAGIASAAHLAPWNEQHRAAVLLVPALGGAERKLAEIASPIYERPVYGSRALTWAPDGKSLVVSDEDARGGPLSLFLVSVNTGVKRELTFPAEMAIGDRSPVFSPDGRVLAFSRTVTTGASDIYVLRLSAELRPEGEPKPLTRGHQWNDSPAWLADGGEILFSSNRGGAQSLWRAPASGAQPARRVPLAAHNATLPAFSRQAHRLVYVESLQDDNIWRTSLTGRGRASGAPKLVIASSRLDEAADYSPDGGRIAFESDRSGSREIWVCDNDGSHARQLTSLNAFTGSPRWSPDGNWIAFDSDVGGQFEIYAIPAEGGAPTLVTDPSQPSHTPAWSRDGAWIYFTSNRAGSTEIWKIRPKGGLAVQVTKHGGLIALESPDSRFLYYKKSKKSPVGISSLWRMPANGGAEEKVIDLVYGRSFTVTEEGVYYARPEAPEGWSIRLFRPGSGTDVRIGQYAKPPALGFSISPDRRWLLYGQVDAEGSDLMLLDGFR